MATRAPYRADTRTYKGTTFAFSFTIKEDSSALDLTTLDKVQIKMFNDAGEVFDYDTNGNLSISGGSNQTVSGTADPTTMDIAIREYYVELWLHYSDGTDDVYAVLHNNIIEASSNQSEGAHDFEIDIDTSAETVSGQPIAVLAEAVDAKEAAETARDQILPSQTTGTEIVFDEAFIYNTPSSPGTGNLTQNVTDARTGVIQKIYHNDSTVPSLPTEWTNVGHNGYLTGNLNIIFAEYVNANRVEYWIG